MAKHKSPPRGPRNAAARALADPLFRKRIVPSGQEYSRGDLEDPLDLLAEMEDEAWDDLSGF